MFWPGDDWDEYDAEDRFDDEDEYRAELLEHGDHDSEALDNIPHAIHDANEDLEELLEDGLVAPLHAGLSRLADDGDDGLDDGDDGPDDFDPDGPYPGGHGVWDDFERSDDFDAPGDFDPDDDVQDLHAEVLEGQLDQQDRGEDEYEQHDDDIDGGLLGGFFGG